MVHPVLRHDPNLNSHLNDVIEGYDDESAGYVITGMAELTANALNFMEDVGADRIFDEGDLASAQFRGLMEGTDVTAEGVVIKLRDEMFYKKDWITGYVQAMPPDVDRSLLASHIDQQLSYFHQEARSCGQDNKCAARRLRSGLRWLQDQLMVAKHGLLVTPKYVKNGVDDGYVYTQEVAYQGAPPDAPVNLFFPTTKCGPSDYLPMIAEALKNRHSNHIRVIVTDHPSGVFSDGYKGRTQAWGATSRQSSFYSDAVKYNRELATAYGLKSREVSITVHCGAAQFLAWADDGFKDANGNKIDIKHVIMFDPGLGFPKDFIAWVKKLFFKCWFVWFRDPDDATEMFRNWPPDSFLFKALAVDAVGREEENSDIWDRVSSPWNANSPLFSYTYTRLMAHELDSNSGEYQDIYQRLQTRKLDIPVTLVLTAGTVMLDVPKVLNVMGRVFEANPASGRNRIIHLGAANADDERVKDLMTGECSWYDPFCSDIDDEVRGDFVRNAGQLFVPGRAGHMVQYFDTGSTAFETALFE